MKRVFCTLICGTVLLFLAGCEMHDMENCCNDPYCGECRGDCWYDGGGWYDDPGTDRAEDGEYDDDYDDDYWGGWCQSDADCPEGHVCDPYDQCVQTVPDCPLTPECLADPEGYAPEWQGIDPVYVGAFSGDASGRVHMLIDFYDDHFYGEAEVVLDRRYEWYYVTLTGSLEGDQLFGQATDAWGDRRYDATFQATLLSASEISGSFEVASDDGVMNGDFVLFRTSPCGCETEEDPPPPPPPESECVFNEDCNADQVCLDGSCTRFCQDDPDCPEGQVCSGCVCVPGCPGECCADADCPEGDACVDNLCKTPCELNCQCDAGEVCEDGFCEIPEEEPPKDCVTDCDCDYAAGERCIDGLCQLP